ncbi:MAG: DUF2225 domain-containing protein [Acidobacteria bacterium]|nr:DUF2225 domain-containing protein [Acidobacteriota bacterium]
MMEFPEETFNPFPGLRPFDTDEYHLFFGRDGQSDELLRRLQQTRFLAVVGTSGSGKSSLIRAGLLPSLYGGLMAGAGSAWRVALFRPGGDPVGNLAAALCSEEALGAGAGESEVQSAIVEATLRRSTLGLVDVVRQARLAPHENLLVVVDQFEELFRFRTSKETHGSEDDAAAFVKLLLEAPQRGPREELARRRKEDPAAAEPPEHSIVPIYVVLTMRSDFLGDCSQFQGLPEAINDGQYFIPRMTRDERRAAITGPAAVGGGSISLPLVNRLLNDVGDNPDQLPIMQHALMRTWDHWAARGNHNGAGGDAGGGGTGKPVDLADYEAVGGMSDALSRHADEAFNELGDDRSRLVAEKMFKALTEKGADNREIRRPVTLGELCEIAEATPEEVVAVVETFRREGRSFLMPPVGTPLETGTVLDISHESLIRNWERLKKWVDDEAQSARIYRRLAEASVLHRAGQEGLLSDPGLQFALDWHDNHQPNAAWGRRYHPEFDLASSFLDASREHRDAQLAEQEQQRQAEIERERRELERARAFAAAQARSARRLRWAAVAMAALFLFALGGAVYAFQMKQRAEDSGRQAREAQTRAEVLKANALASYDAEKAAREDAQRQNALAKTNEERAVEEQKRAEVEKTRANEQTRIASEREQEARDATVRQLESARAAEAAATAARTAEAEANRRGERLQVDAMGRFGLDSFQRGNYSGAEYAFQMALSMIGENGVSDSGEVKDRDLAKSQGWVLANIGLSQRKLGNYAGAVKSYQRALAIHEKVTPQVSGEMFDALHWLGHAYRDGGDADRANEFYTRAVELLVKNPTLIDSIYELPNLEIIARLYRDLGRYDEAEPYFRRVLEERGKRKNENELTDALKEIAQFYAAQNRWEKAEALYSDLLAIQEKSFTDGKFADVDFRALADSYGDLGEIYIGLDELKAKTLFQLARAAQDFSLKQRQRERLMAAAPGEAANADKIKALKMDRDLVEMADLFVRLGELRPAETSYRQALEYVTDDANYEAEVMLKLGRLFRFHLKEYDKAAEAYRAAVGTLTGKKDSSLLLGEAMTQLGTLFAEELNRPDDAVKLFKEALEELSQLTGAERATYSTLSGLASVHGKQNRVADLIAVSQRKLELAREMVRRNSPNSVAQKAWDAGAYAEAFGLYVRAVSDLSAAYRAGGDSLCVRKAYSALLAKELDVNQVVDEQVVAAYTKLLQDYDNQLSSQHSAPPPTSTLKERIRSARAQQSQIEQITQQQIRRQAQQTYAPTGSPQ